MPLRLYGKAGHVSSNAVWCAAGMTEDYYGALINNNLITNNTNKVRNIREVSEFAGIQRGELCSQSLAKGVTSYYNPH